MPTPSLDEFHELTEVEDLRKALSRAQRQLREAKARKEHLVTAAHDGAKDAFLALGQPPEVPKPTHDQRKGKPEVAVVHLSDWQTGKKTSSFDSDVAEERVGLLADLVVQMTEIERSAHPVRECHVLFGGDFVEGVTIFPGQQWEIDSTIFEQQVRASRMAVNFVRRMCAVFQTVQVWCEDGNHGRIGKRGDVPKEDNNDRFVYHTTRLQLADLERAGRLVWHEEQGWHSIVEIGNYRALLVHGDEIKSFGGNTPAFGIAKKVTAWAAGVIEPFHDCYMGHWHQPLVVPMAVGNRRIFVNPSIESDSVYAQEFVGAVGFPGQRLNYVDPGKGRVTTERILWLA